MSPSNILRSALQHSGRSWPAALVVLVMAFLGSASLEAQCTNRVQWPTSVDPTWDFCFRRPSDTTPSANGTGLEVYDVHYKGTLVIKEVDIPVLNVKYDTGGCGGPGLCYRDWFDEERFFTCAPETSSGVCSGTTSPAQTVCAHPGDEFGSFNGVAVEDLGTSVRLTAQTSAGWYRYIPVYEFFPDGTINFAMSFTSTDNPCVASDHNHHAYFRIDMDVDGPGGDYVDVISPGGPTRVTTEASYIDTSPDRSHWRVGSAGTDWTVDVMRNTIDQGAGDADLVPDDFPVADGWVLAYDASETGDDSSQSLFDCPVQLDPYVDNENVDGTDLVMWVHAASYHPGEPGGVVTVCTLAGPTIKVNEGSAFCSAESIVFCDDLESGNADSWASTVP